MRECGFRLCVVAGFVIVDRFAIDRLLVGHRFLSRIGSQGHLLLCLGHGAVVGERIVSRGAVVRHGVGGLIGRERLLAFLKFGAGCFSLVTCAAGFGQRVTEGLLLLAGKRIAADRLQRGDGLFVLMGVVLGDALGELPGVVGRLGHLRELNVGVRIGRDRRSSAGISYRCTRNRCIGRPGRAGGVGEQQESCRRGGGNGGGQDHGAAAANRTLARIGDVGTVGFAGGSRIGCRRIHERTIEEHVGPPTCANLAGAKSGGSS